VVVAMLNGQIRTALFKTVAGVLFSSFLWSGTVHARNCSAQDAEAADAIVDHLDSWVKIKRAFNKYGHCDSGYIAEGNSEAVARMLVDRWQTLPTLEKLSRRDPSFKRFVLHHIDATLDTGDLEKIKVLSSSSCPSDITVLCRALLSAATDATK
jgi:hypothetical protein